MGADRCSSRACLLWLAAVWTFIYAANGQATQSLACEATGHCSLGKVQPWTGDITPAAGLRSMLAARSYKKELVLVVSNAAFVAVNLQPYLHMKRLGMAHLALMAGDEEQCKEIAGKLPEVGCAWNSAPEEAAPPDLAFIGRLWWMRYRTVLRAARLGYNVYSMDGDSVIFDNFYRIVDAPWAKNITWWNQIEGGPSINGGQVYLRNAAPDGAAVQTLWLVLNVALRWNDDDWAYAKSRGVRKHCLYMDQDALNAVMESQWVGDGTFTLCAANTCIPDEKVTQKCADKPKDWEVTTQVQLDSYLSVLADTEQYKFKYRPLRVMHTKGWPGGRWWPSDKGKYSRYLMKLLAEDCPGCPALLDPEDPATAATAAAAPLEALAVMPPWFTEGWMGRGKYGYWTPSLLGGQPRKQAIGHMWFLHGTPDSLAGKMYAMQALGAFDFDFVRTTMGKEPYPACYDRGNPSVRSTDPAVGSCEGLKLLAWHPDVALQDTGSPYELALLMRGMAQLAALMGRTLVWPHLPCNATRYISKRPVVKPGELYTYSKSSRPLDLWTMWFPHGDFRCSWSLTFPEGCMNKKRSMQWWEAADWMKRLPGGSVVAPSKGVNIIGAVDAAADNKEAQQTGDSPEDEEESTTAVASGGSAASRDVRPSSSKGRLVVANVTLSFQVAGDNATVQELLVGMNDLLAARQRRHSRRSRKKRSSSSSSSSSEERPPPSRHLASLAGLNQRLGAWPRRLLQRHILGDPATAFDAILSPFIKTTIEVTAEQVQSFVQGHQDLMRQPVLYLATPVRVKELQANSSSSLSSKGVQEVLGQYNDFVSNCVALNDEKLIEKTEFEYGDRSAPMDALITEGKALAVRPGVIVVQ